MIKHFAPMAACAALILAGISGCGDADKQPGKQKLSVTAGLPPVAHIVARVAGDAVRVHTLLRAGQNPHDYSPTPREIADLRASKAFFIVGLPFEKLAGRGMESRLCDVAEQLPRVDAEGDGCHGHAHAGGAHACASGHAHHKDAHADAKDPHVWLNPDFCAAIAGRVAEKLSSLDPAHAAEYRANAGKYAGEMKKLAAGLEEKLKPYAQRGFYVHHSAYVYFANRFRLRQRSVEPSGREVSARHLAELAAEMRRNHAGVMIVPPSLNESMRRALSQATGAQVREFDHLAENVEANIERLGNVLAEDFAVQDRAGAAKK